MTSLLLSIFLGVLAAPAQQGISEPAPMDQHAQYWVTTLKDHPLNLVRKNAARVLGTLGNREAVPALLDALGDANPGVRVEAAKSLGMLGDERALGPLFDVSARDKDKQLRSVARQSIEQIKAYQEYQKKKAEDLR